MIQLQEKCVPFSGRYKGGCGYFACGGGKRFHVVCVCRRGMHGPVDEAGRPVVFVSRRAAQPVVDLLNAALVGQRPAGGVEKAR